VQGVRLTVMVVEDEALIRLDVVLELEAAGFDVVDASTADEALEVLVARHDVVALFTDVNMPGELNGIELAHLAYALHPDIRIIVTSGVGSVEEGALPPGGRFVPKPYVCSRVAALLAV
jgi:YesN/AraC family two-component response regulator